MEWKKTNVYGTIKWYILSKWYGFIMRDDTADDIFFHWKDIMYISKQEMMDKTKIPHVGERVRFQMWRDDNGKYRALDIYLVEWVT